MVQSSRLDVSKKAPIFGKRHLQCLLLFFAIALAFAKRVNFSLGIVAMTDSKSANKNFEEYDWSEKTKSYLLSSFSWGYVTTQILGGYLARRFGGKLTLGTGMFISSVATISNPLCARIGDWKLLLGLRVLQGISQGVIFPSTHTLLARWAPSEEVAELGTYLYGGSQFGTVVMFLVGGLIAASSLGWPGLFYIPGGLGLLWCVCWYLWGASTPNGCKTISSTEKLYINQSVSNGEADQRDDAHLHKTPWLKFFTSLPFWSLFVVHTAFNWFFWTMLTQIPAYMKNVLGFNIKDNALLSALPYLVKLVLNVVFAWLSTWISRRKLLSVTSNRKLFNTIAMWIPAVFLVWLAYVDTTNTTLAVVLLVIAIALGAASHLGFMVNHIDLSPNFAGILFGFTNMAANVMGTLAPLTVGLVVSDAKNPLQWRIVFFISAAFCFFGNLLFLFFGSAKTQTWNQPEECFVQNDEPMLLKTEISKENSSSSKELETLLVKNCDKKPSENV